MRFRTSQYTRFFIPAVTKLCNELSSMIVAAVELQKFKLSANLAAFLLGVDGLQTECKYDNGDKGSSACLKCRTSQGSKIRFS